MIETILYDLDNDTWSGRKALKMAAQLIAFAVCKALRLRPRKDFAFLCDDYALRLVKLNKMLGIKTIVGIRSELSKPELVRELRIINPQIDLRAHLHIGDNKDPDRQRLWVPALNQSRLTWHFEDQYAKQGKAKLLRTDLPCFHFDNPENLGRYVDFLFCRYLDADADLEIIN